MGLTTDGMSPADLAAVTGNNNGAFSVGQCFSYSFCGNLVFHKISSSFLHINDNITKFNFQQKS